MELEEAVMQENHVINYKETLFTMYFSCLHEYLLPQYASNDETDLLYSPLGKIPVEYHIFCSI